MVRKGVEGGVKEMSEKNLNMQRIYPTNTTLPKTTSGKTNIIWSNWPKKEHHKHIDEKCRDRG